MLPLSLMGEEMMAVCGGGTPVFISRYLARRVELGGFCGDRSGRLCTDHRLAVGRLHGGRWTGWMGSSGDSYGSFWFFRVCILLSCLLVSWLLGYTTVCAAIGGVHMYWIV